MGGLNAFYWHQIFALDSIVAKTQKSEMKTVSHSQSGKYVG